MDPSRIGTLEPGRQTITIEDRLLGPIELVAALPVFALYPCGMATFPIVSEGWSALAVILTAAAALNVGVALLCLGWLLRWWWAGPTVLVLRDGALTLTTNRVTRTLAYADLAGATARRVGPYSELVIRREDGELVIVPIGGLFRARAMALAIDAAISREGPAADEDADARRALDKLRRAEPVRS